MGIWEALFGAPARATEPHDTALPPHHAHQGRPRRQGERAARSPDDDDDDGFDPSDDGAPSDVDVEDLVGLLHDMEDYGVDPLDIAEFD